MSTAPDTGQSDRDGAALTAALAEYEALRSEMSWLIEHSAQLQNLAIGLLIAVLPVVTFFLDKDKPALLVGVLLSLPIAFSLLGLLYFRQHQEVYVVAAYIKHRVRPVIRQLAGRDDIWTWEDFKASRLEALSARSPIHGAWRPASVLLLRLGIFTMPAVASLLLAVSVAASLNLESLQATYTGGGTVVLLVFAALDVVLIVVLIIRFVEESDLGRRVLDASELR